MNKQNTFKSCTFLLNENDKGEIYFIIKGLKRNPEFFNIIKNSLNLFSATYNQKTKSDTSILHDAQVNYLKCFEELEKQVCANHNSTKVDNYTIHNIAYKCSPFLSVAQNRLLSETLYQAAVLLHMQKVRGELSRIYGLNAEKHISEPSRKSSVSNTSSQLKSLALCEKRKTEIENQINTLSFEWATTESTKIKSAIIEKLQKTRPIHSYLLKTSQSPSRLTKLSKDLMNEITLFKNTEKQINELKQILKTNTDELENKTTQDLLKCYENDFLRKKIELGLISPNEIQQEPQIFISTIPLEEPASSTAYTNLNTMIEEQLLHHNHSDDISF